jgi:hypothetical protein
VAPGTTVTPGWTKTVSPGGPAELLALEWTGSRAGAVDVRVQQHGKWLKWVTLESDPDEGPDRGSVEYRGLSTAGPAWMGGDVDRIQLRVANGRLGSLQLHLIHSPKAAPPRVPMASASPAQPGIITRAQWGANESIRNSQPDCTQNPEYASGVRYAVVHHTVSVNDYSADDAYALVRGIYQFHVQGNHWCDIGYNVLVDRFGRVFEGRYGGITRPVIGAHAEGFNNGSTGVSMIGDFQGTQPTAAAVGAVRDLLAWKMSFHGADPGANVTVTSGGSSKYPAGQVVTLPTIIGHRDVSDTACPGERAYPLLPQLRADVQATILATPPYPLPGWAPVSAQPKVLTLNGFGGLEPAGGQPAVSHTSYWPEWDIARATTGGASGYVLDGWGGLHPYGGAPTVATFDYWPGWDIARGIVKSTSPGMGYVLDGWGGLHPYGGAPFLAYTGYWRGWDIARGLVIRADGLGGYVLDGWGGVHAFGAATPVRVTGYWNGWDIARGIALRSDGNSGYVLDGWGGLHPFGGAPAVTVSRYTPNSDQMRGVTLNADGTGGWVVDWNGVVWPFGSASAVKQSGTHTGRHIGRAVVVAG